VGASNLGDFAENLKLWMKSPELHPIQTNRRVKAELLMQGVLGVAGIFCIYVELPNKMIY